MGLESRVYCAEQIEVPPELPQLIKSFTKEAIRYNDVEPDLVKFAKDYFTHSCAGELDKFLADCEAKNMRASNAYGAAPAETEESEQQSEEALRMLQTVFAVLDTNLDDLLTMEEIRKGIENTPLGDNVLGYLDQLIGENEIDFESFQSFFQVIRQEEVETIRNQWLAKYYDRRHTQEVLEMYTRVFNVWDEDGSGAISMDELVTAVKLAELPEKLIDYLCRADVNNDNTISLHEFLCFMPHVEDVDLMEQSLTLGQRGPN